MNENERPADLAVEDVPPAEPEPEPDAVRSESDIDKATVSLEKEATRHANRVSQIMGEDAQTLIPCERCWPLAPGFHFPPDVVPVDDDQRAAVLASIGMGDAGEPDLQMAEGVRECERCVGHGKLRYPTRNPHMGEQTCPACSGNGYVTVAPPLAAVASPAPFTPTPSVGGQSSAGACPLCGTAGMLSQPHWCNPQAAQG